MGSFEELCGSNQPEAKKFRGAFREDGDDSPIRPDELDDFAEGLIDDGYYVLPGSGFRPPDRPLPPPNSQCAWFDFGAVRRLLLALYRRIAL